MAGDRDDATPEDIHGPTPQNTNVVAIFANVGITDSGVTTVYEVRSAIDKRMFVSEDIDLALTYIKSYLTGGTN